MTHETPLHQNMFTGELVDRRTRTQKKQDRARDTPKQQEMFRQRELAQFGVKVKQMDAPAAPLVLIREDPRTEEEKERDRQREAESLTQPMFAENVSAAIALEQVETPFNSCNPDSALQKKREAYRTLVEIAQEQQTTTWVDPLYTRQFTAQLPLAILEAHDCGLTPDEITTATQIGHVMGNEAVRASRVAEATSSPTPTESSSLFSASTLYEQFRRANVPCHMHPTFSLSVPSK